MNEWPREKATPTTPEEDFYAENRALIANDQVREEALKNGDEKERQVYEKLKGILAKKILVAYENYRQEGAHDETESLNELEQLIGHDGQKMGRLASIIADWESARLFHRLYATFMIEGKRLDPQELRLHMIDGPILLDHAPELEAELKALLEATRDSEPSVQRFLEVIEESKGELERFASAVV